VSSEVETRSRSERPSTSLGTNGGKTDRQMKLTSISAIFMLFWAFSFFLVLPFRLQSREAPGEYVPGQAESAPPSFSFGRTAKWTTVVALVLFGLYYLNYVNGWIPVDSLDLVHATHPGGQ